VWGYQYHKNGVFRHPSNVRSFSAAGALDRPQRNVPTGNRVNSLNTISLPYIEILRGRDGRDGQDGIPGPRGPQGQREVARATGPLVKGVVMWSTQGTCPNVQSQRRSSQLPLHAW